MISDKSRQQLSDWWRIGKERFIESMKHNNHDDYTNLIGTVINPQYIKLLKLKRNSNEYEVEYFNVVDLPEGLIDTEIKNPAAVAEILKNIFSKSHLNSKDLVLSIPRSSCIVKSIVVDKRLHPDEIESRVWLEAGRLFPNLIGEIYLDFAVHGPSAQDASQVEILIVACRKDQIKPYLDIVRLAGLNLKIIDINYYAYERSLTLITKQSPQIKTVALLNISFKLIDLLVENEGNLIYTHESSYDGKSLLRYKIKNASEKNENTTDSANQVTENLKNTIGIHLKHALQFFYSSRPNVRIDRIILGGDAAAAIPQMLEFIQQESGKEVVLADPLKDMKLSPNIDKDMLSKYGPGLMLCCGLALTKLI